MKSALKVGTWPWLLRHEVRLQWRAIGGARLWLVGIFGGFLWLALHAAAWGLLRGLDAISLPPKAVFIFGGLTWLLITLMFSQAIMQSVTALFDRGDFDLLLSSPLNTRTVFTVRGLGIAATSVVLYFFLATPFAHVGVFTGRANLLAIYPAMLSIGLLVASLGMLITLSLVRLLGARRARVAAQLFGAIVGATIFLLTQLQNMLGRQTREQIAAVMKNAAEPGGVLAPDSALWFPFRAFTGEPTALLSVVILGVGGFFLVVNLTYKRFLSGTQESVTGSANKTNSSAGVKQKRFQRARGGFIGIVLMKEWRLIWRDPQLIAQTFLQILYLLPIVFLVYRNSAAVSYVIPGAILLASTLAGSLAWITVAAEEAPELIGTAPISLTRIRWLKVLAAMIPVWILVSPILFFLLTKNLMWAGVFLFCLAGSTACAGMIQVWYPRIGDRKNMKKRAQGGMLINLIEGLCAFGWSGAAYALMQIPSPWAWLALVGLAFAALGPLGAWVLGRSRREQGALV
jgi:ABC-2 type transport system permease protein